MIPPHPWLYGLTVVAERRGEGIGTQLIREAERLCIDRGASHASLDVDIDNLGALRLYERLGYRIVGPHQHHWRTIDHDSGEVLAQGAAATWLMRATLGSAGAGQR